MIFEKGQGEGMDVLKIAVLAVSAVLLALMLKQTKPEYSVFISMAACICIFYTCCQSCKRCLDIWSS